MFEKLTDTSADLFDTLKRFCIVVVFSIAFAYIEAAVVVYLRQIFYPDGFTFPLAEFGLDISPLWRRLLLTELGREAATMVLILTGCRLFGRSRRQRLAWFLVIFAVWDIFYYVWLKVLVNWPGSIMDWDILFLMPLPWASPVLAPMLVSMTMLVFALVILYRCACAKPLKAGPMDWVGFCFAALIVVISFCLGGSHITEADFASYFHWPIFAAGEALAIATFIRCLLKSK